jgi:CarboxypepD_reg-like domain
MKKAMTCLALLMAINMMAQRSIKGTITDEKGEPCVGASVIIKGTPTGTVTDVDGLYTIKVNETNAILSFSFGGMVTQEHTLGLSDTLNIVLKDANIEEIIIAGIMKNKHLPYQHQRVSEDDISSIRNDVPCLLGKIEKKCRTVKGTVTDSEGVPIVGEYQTDDSGKFAVCVPKASILIFSFMGKTSKEVRIRRKSSHIDVRL